jgi:hypothetical protein
MFDTASPSNDQLRKLGFEPAAKLTFEEDGRDIGQFKPTWNTMHRNRAGKIAWAAVSCFVAGANP